MEWLFIMNSSWPQKKISGGGVYKSVLDVLARFLWKGEKHGVKAETVTSARFINDHSVIKHLISEGARQRTESYSCSQSSLSSDCLVIAALLQSEPCLSGSLNNVDCCVCVFVYFMCVVGTQPNLYSLSSPTTINHDPSH